MEGWVKLRRKAQNNIISNNLELFGLFSFFLIKANHKWNDIMINMQKVNIQPWQFVWSMQGIADRFGISKAKVYRMVKLLEDEKIVKHKWYSKYSLFTILNRHLYQDKWNADDTTNDTTNETQTIRKQEWIKNEKNEKEIIGNLKEKNWLQEKFPDIDEKRLELEIISMIDWSKAKRKPITIRKTFVGNRLKKWYQKKKIEYVPKTEEEMLNAPLEDN